MGRRTRLVAFASLGALGCATSEASVGPPHAHVACDPQARSGATINEVSAWSDSWVELANPAAEPVDLGGWVLATADEEGQPTLASALTFAGPTSIEPGGYLLVVGEASSSGVLGIGGMHLGCIGGADCVRVGWAFDPRQTNRLVLLDATGCFVADARVPPPAPGSVAQPDDSTWSRVPDGRGAFVSTRPTPGGSNVRP